MSYAAVSSFFVRNNHKLAMSLLTLLNSTTLVHLRMEEWNRRFRTARGITTTYSSREILISGLPGQQVAS